MKLGVEYLNIEDLTLDVRMSFKYLLVCFFL